MVKWMTCCHKHFTRRGKKEGGKGKGRKNKSDLICEQYTNACKLGANWDEQDFKNHAKLITII